MTKVITVTEMARSLSDIIGQVYYKHNSFNIKKGLNIVATLSPARNKPTIEAKNLNDFFKNAPHLEESDSEEFQNDISQLRLLRDNEGFNKWD